MKTMRKQDLIDLNLKEMNQLEIKSVDGGNIGIIMYGISLAVELAIETYLSTRPL
jgi:hypothetical protein